MIEQPIWDVVFYANARGRMPLDDWIRSLPVKDSVRIFKTIGLLKQYGVQLTMPHARHITGKLWELRIAAGRRDYRILYAAIVRRRFLLLHGFMKTTPKTPLGDLEIAERRLSEYQTRMTEG